MSDFIAFDTSNYTTSVAALKDGELYSERMLLPVGAGEKGLRQSDAVFLHTKQLYRVADALAERCGGLSPVAVGFSGGPRDVPGSYMPCFLVGENAAKTLAAFLGVPAYRFSHQAGHIMAGVYSCGNSGAFKDEFIFFHVSGGTTETLAVRPEKGGFDARIICATADISIGQLIDRAGVMLGMGFPAGNELEETARGFSGKLSAALNKKPVMKDGAINLSGFENNLKRAFESGVPKEEIAFAALSFSASALEMARGYAESVCGKRPVLFAGGVMRNGYIRSVLEAENTYFASRELSSDNAAGTVLLTRDRFNSGE